MLFGRNTHFLVYMVTHCLETHIIAMCSLAIYFLLSQMKHTSFLIHFPCFRMLNIPHIIFVRSSCTSHSTVFIKRAVSRDISDVQTSTGAYWKDNELQNRLRFVRI